MAGFLVGCSGTLLSGLLRHVSRALQMVRMLDSPLRFAYDLFLPALSGLGIAYCYGSGYVMRREALMAVKGWSTFTYAVEDVPTTVYMDQLGWTSKFLNVTLAEGQRQAWSCGSPHIAAACFPAAASFTCTSTPFPQVLPGPYFYAAGSYLTCTSALPLPA